MTDAVIQSLDYQRVFESVPGCYLILSPDLVILDASDAYLNATKSSREEIVGRGIFEVFPDNPNDSNASGASNLRTSLYRVLRDRVPDTMALQRYDIRRPSGEGGAFEERYWSPVNLPVLRDGQLECIVHSVKDVTEFVIQQRADNERVKLDEELRRRADSMAEEIVIRSREIQDTNARLEGAAERLRESEERSRLVMEGVREYAIFFMDTKGFIQTWSAGARRIKGYTAEEILGKHFSIFYPPADVKSGKPERELRIALETGQYEEEGWRVRKDGSLIWANVLITALRNSEGKHVGFGKVTRDLSERQFLREERDRFFNMSQDMLGVADFEGRFTRVNQAFTEVLGYSEQELISRPYLELVHPDDVEATRKMAERLATSGEGIELENRYRCKDGSYRWLSWVARTDMPSKRIFAAARDITGRKQAEVELQQLNKALVARGQQLEAANKELEAFSYSVSHDLRSPLRAIDGFSLAVMEDCADKLDETNRENLNRVRSAAQRMAKLIDDMLNLSRLTRVDMSVEAVDLSQMAREIVGELRASEPGRQVEFVVADGLTVTADRRLLHVAMSNLLGNAWKFTGKQAAASIELGREMKDGAPVYFVRDNGAGFDMAYVPKLFGAFQRLHAANDFPGTGIGLALVHRILTRHGGKVWAQGAVNAGATFYFSL